MPRYIDADFLIDKLKEQANIPCNKRAVPVSWSYAYKEFIDNIENAPTADVEPVRHGHWIHGECGNDKYIKCSFCRKKIVNNIVTLEGDIAETAFVLCPYCGTRMDGDAE